MLCHVLCFWFKTLKLLRSWVPICTWIFFRRASAGFLPEIGEQCLSSSDELVSRNLQIFLFLTLYLSMTFLLFLHASPSHILPWGPEYGTRAQKIRQSHPLPPDHLPPRQHLHGQPASSPRLSPALVYWCPLEQFFSLKSQEMNLFHFASAQSSYWFSSSWLCMGGKSVQLLQILVSVRFSVMCSLGQNSGLY